MFIDSMTALSSIVNGWSRHEDTSLLCHSLWRVCNNLGTFAYFDRVESKSNIADGPTKGRLSNLELLGARQISPVTDALFESL